MHRIIAKYSLAVHLAVLAVAPLLLCLFPMGRYGIGVANWLSFFALIWMLMQPSCLSGETPSVARDRAWRNLTRDPVVWALAAALVYSAISAINGGVRMVYDAESMNWRLKLPMWEALPCSVSGAGEQWAALAVAMLIVVAALRNALGRRARTFFALVASTLSAMIALGLVLVVLAGEGSLLAESVRWNGVWFGGFATAFGFWAMIAVAVMMVGDEQGGAGRWPICGFALCGNMVGVAVFCPIATSMMFAVAILSLVVVGWRWCRSRLPSFRLVMVGSSIILALLLASLLIVFGDLNGLMAVKRESFSASGLFPNSYWKVKSLLSSAAVKAWMDNPYLGTGIGSFGYDLRFNLDGAAINAVPRGLDDALNLWLQLLAERGVVGIFFLALPFGFLIGDSVRRMIKAGNGLERSILLWLGVATLLIGAVVSYFGCALTQPSVSLVMATSLAMGCMSIRSRVDLVAKGGE